MVRRYLSKLSTQLKYAYRLFGDPPTHHPNQLGPKMPLYHFDKRP